MRVRIQRNPYLKCRPLSVKMEQLIMEFSGEPVKMCGRAEQAMTGILDGAGIRLPRFCKTPGIPRIRAKPKPYCIQGSLTEDQRQGGYGLTLPPYNPGVSLDQPYWNKKVYSDPQMRAFTGQIGPSGGADWINHRIIRYADVLLMMAEALNEVGDTSATSYLEQVRARARGSNPTALPYIPYQSQAQMRKAIKNERRWELAMEGFRFYDLVRWTPATDSIDAPHALGSLGYTLRNALYPIPQPAIDLSGGVLVQNPNY